MCAPPPRRAAGRSGRSASQKPRPGKLSPEQSEAVRTAVARGRSLRDVAAEYGVSRQTVLNIARQARAMLGA